MVYVIGFSASLAGLLLGLPYVSIIAACLIVFNLLVEFTNEY